VENAVLGGVFGVVRVGVFLGWGFGVGGGGEL